MTRRHVRIALVEPGAVATELQSHNRPEVRGEIEFVVTRPPRVAVNEVLVRPTEQEG